VIRSLARVAPGRCARLLLFDFVPPGIGPRFGAPERLQENWCQSFDQLSFDQLSFHQMPFAEQLRGASRQSGRAHVGHILRHGSHRAEAWEPLREAWVDNLLRSGNVDGGFRLDQPPHAKRLIR